jgi:hypothetical protein
MDGGMKQHKSRRTEDHKNKRSKIQTGTLQMIESHSGLRGNRGLPDAASIILCSSALLLFCSFVFLFFCTSVLSLFRLSRLPNVPKGPP